jgi:small subunit ribosomal protein S4
MKLFLKGTRCYTKKCAVERRPTPPGQHAMRRRKVSEYGVQLREKQKVRRTYYVLERQFQRYFDAAESRPGVTGENLLRLLETRLDNVVYRLGFATSRPQARQLVGHRHFLLNGRPVNIPSMQVKEGDRIEVREGSRKSEYFKTARERMDAAQVPDWLRVEPDKLAGTVTGVPRREQMPQEFNEQLVVEYYSR